MTNWRLICFQYFGDNSVAAKPIISDMLQISNANAGNTYGTFSSFDIDYDKQYRVLWDSKVITTFGAPTGITSTYVGISHADMVTIPLSRADRNIAYYTGGVTGPNHLYLLATTDAANAVTNPSITYATEVRFIDA